MFKDLGFSDAEAERALLKADLAFEIYNIIEAQKLTQAQAGKILGVAPSDISRLKKVILTKRGAIVYTSQSF